MKDIDKLIKRVKAVTRLTINELEHYDFTKLTYEELVELAYGCAEERFHELIKQIER